MLKNILIATLAACLVSPVLAQQPAPSPAAASAEVAPTKPKKPPTAKQLAAREKMKACGAEWREKKKAGATTGMTWRDFSKECLART